MLDLDHFHRSRKNITRSIFTVITIFSLSMSSAWAITSSEVLPQGVRALAFVYVDAPNVSNSFNANGNLDSLARPLNRSITIDDLQKYEPKIKTLRSTLNSISPNQYGEQVLASNLYSHANVQEHRYIGGLLWGINNKFTAGVIVPIIKRQVQFDWGVDTVNNALQLNQIVGTKTPKISEAFQQIQDMRFDQAFFEKKIFTDAGYAVPKSYEANGMGDIELEGRLNYLDGERVGLGARSTIKLPTATHKADLRNVIDRDFGDSCYSLKVGSVQTWKLIPGHFNLQNGFFGSWRAPTHETMAVAKTGDQTLPDLTDPYQIESVRKKLGSQFDVDTGFNWDFNRGVVSIFSSYQFSVRGGDKYSGDRTLAYAKLGENTAMQSQTVESGVEFSSVPLYLSKKWPVPGKMIFTWLKPVGGKNNLYASYGRFDAILFF